LTLKDSSDVGQSFSSPAFAVLASSRGKAQTIGPDTASATSSRASSSPAPTDTTNAASPSIKPLNTGPSDGSGATDDDADKSDRGGLGGGALAGIGVGASLAVISLTGIALFTWLRRRREKRKKLREALLGGGGGGGGGDQGGLQGGCYYYHDGQKHNPYLWRSATPQELCSATGPVEISTSAHNEHELPAAAGYYSPVGSGRRPI